jgi:hypothetical protein
LANKVTPDDILQMNILYLELKTYAAVARKTGFSAGTVKKYIIPNFTLAAEKTKWEGELLPIGSFTITCKDLDDQELSAIQKLRKEIEI